MENYSQQAYWLYSLKLNLAITDNERDAELIELIDIAHINIWTQFYELKLENDAIPSSHPWAFDNITKRATLHLAATYFMNPDINMQGSNVIDNRMIYRILGGRVKYA
ncbi:hypothetical protein HLA87_02430 [Mycoplasma miroungigenitalium]|uniref:Phage gp6-like head-tail connector protein n=1 Tax=Mycoplasma miroungigenitalium TaxID=754515 RepID=A0A6M4JG15_9MOLU|nr:hypothetical protein [Mycoplasma miroungigenitalium]QJR43631.1 hypothetical protein HLA87_02430 [Mycoplasma miroungigenitalium]